MSPEELLKHFSAQLRVRGSPESADKIDAISAQLSAANKAFERFKRDYERVPFNERIFEYIDDYERSGAVR